MGALECIGVFSLSGWVFLCGFVCKCVPKSVLFSNVFSITDQYVQLSGRKTNLVQVASTQRIDGLDKLLHVFHLEKDILQETV